MSVHLGGRVFWQWKLDVPLAPGDILIINGNPRFLSNYPLWARAKLLGVPVVWWGHGWSGGSFGTRSKLRQWLMRFADAVVLYTDKERDDYLALGFAPDQTGRLHDGIRPDSRNFGKPTALDHTPIGASFLAGCPINRELSCSSSPCPQSGTTLA
jgi:hypothetical protein